MVKKHKSGRRQILQLEDKKPTHGEWESSSATVLNKDATPLDSQVADFFKEINAMTVNEQAEGITDVVNSVTNDDDDVCPKDKAAEESKVPSIDGSEMMETADNELSEKATEDSENYCPWQELWDKSSGYSYYWNMQTNEVTWDCPPEYAKYLKYTNSDEQSVTHSAETNLNDDQTVGRDEKCALKADKADGSAIPISYFGGSSSESSDEEGKNGVSTSVKKGKKSKTKATSSWKDKIDDDKSQLSTKVIGPQLPPDFQASNSSFSVSATPVSHEEYEIISKNEVEEFLEVGPQLPTYMTNDLRRNLDSVSGSNSPNVGSSSSSQSVNGFHIATSSYESSPKVMIEDSKKYERENNSHEGSPDSNARQGENSSDYLTDIPAKVFRPVVEYDSFTDDDDDEEESNSSSVSSFKNVSSQEISYQNRKTEIDQPEGQFGFSKRKANNTTQENVYKDSIKKAKKGEIIDIDGIFAACASSGKYGFGFSRQEQLNLENERFSSANKQITSEEAKCPSKRHSDYRGIKFIKSDHVFDLNTLNQSASSEDLNQEDSLKEASNTNICVSLSEVTSSVKDNIPKKNENQNITDYTQQISLASKELCSLNNNPDLMHKSKIFSSLESNITPQTTAVNKEDKKSGLEEAMRKALEAKKKIEQCLQRPFSSTHGAYMDKKMTSVPRKLDGASGSESITAEKMAELTDLASVLVDKLTFLISNHSFLASLSGLLVQLQTRIVDWRAGALDVTYFMSRVQEVHQYLHHYEMAAGSGDWTCQWDRESKRYYYMNTKTHQCQWTYPEELCSQEKSWLYSASDTSVPTSISMQEDENEPLSSSVSEGSLLNTESISLPSKSAETESSNVSEQSPSNQINWLLLCSPPPPPPGVDTLTTTAVPPPPRESPPHPPVDSTEVGNQLEDMDLEDSNDSEPLTNSTEDNHIEA